MVVKSRRRGRGLAGIAAAASIAAFALACLTAARADDSAPPAPPPDKGSARSLSERVENFGVARNPYVRPLAKALGVAADPGTPADFVVKSRPPGGEEYIPVGRKEAEHPRKVKTPAELKAMQADFDGVKVQHDAIRATFAPAVKAVADAEAAKAAKAVKPKSAAPPPASAQ